MSLVICINHKSTLESEYEKQVFRAIGGRIGHEFYSLLKGGKK